MECGGSFQQGTSPHQKDPAHLPLPTMSTPTLYTGLDLHKRSLTATTLDAQGHEVAHAKLPCRSEALRLYFADCPEHHQATVEATNGWYWVKDALEGTEVELHLAHAKAVKAITAAKVKTDPADARMLAQLLRTDLLPEAHMISDERRPLRDVLRTRLRLAQDAAWARRTRSPACWRS